MEFEAGDRVLLSTRNLNLKGPAKGSKKLLPKWVGPFQVTKWVNKVAYRLALPGSMSRIHDIFHVSLLKEYRNDGRVQPPPLEIEGKTSKWSG